MPVIVSFIPLDCGASLCLWGDLERPTIALGVAALICILALALFHR